MSHQAVGGGAQSDGDFAAIAIVCERGVLAAVMLDEAPHGVFGPTPIHYSFDEGAWMTRSWVHANGQATSFDDTAAFAAQVMTHDRLRIRRGRGGRARIFPLGRPAAGPARARRLRREEGVTPPATSPARHRR